MSVMPGRSSILLLNYHDAVIYASDLALLDSKTAWLNDACINYQMTRLQRTQGERWQQSPPEGEARHPKRRRDASGEGGPSRHEKMDDLFIDPSVVSFLVHQLSEGDEEYEDELSNLGSSWNLPRTPSRRDGARTNAVRKRAFVPVSDQFGASRSAFARPGGGSHWSTLLWVVSVGFADVDRGLEASVDVTFRHFDSSDGYNAPAAAAVARKLLEVLRLSMPVECAVPHAVEMVECQAPQQRNGHDCGVFALGFMEALSAAHDCGFSKDQDEALLQFHFEKNGGQEKFASELRRRIANDIRKLEKEAVAR